MSSSLRVTIVTSWRVTKRVLKVELPMIYPTLPVQLTTLHEQNKLTQRHRWKILQLLQVLHSKWRWRYISAAAATHASSSNIDKNVLTSISAEMAVFESSSKLSRWLETVCPTDHIFFFISVHQFSRWMRVQNWSRVQGAYSQRSKITRLKWLSLMLGGFYGCQKVSYAFLFYLFHSCFHVF